MTGLHEAVSDYLTIRRALGFKLVEHQRLLPDFASFLEQTGASTISTALAVDWAIRTSGSDSWKAARLSIVRGFAGYLRTIDPTTEIPPEGLLCGEPAHAIPCGGVSGGVFAGFAPETPLRTGPFRPETPLRLRIGPFSSETPGKTRSQIVRAIAYRLWTGRGREVGDRHGAPFYGFVELQPGPSSDEFFFRYDYVPVAGAGGQVALVDSAFVQAMREGWVVMIHEVNTARDVALLSINATLDGRLSLYLAATGETVVTRPGFAVLLAYNPGLVGATDIPDAWHSRFPATLEVTSNWAALAELGAPGQLVTEAMRLDRQRIAGEDGLCWTPQFRDIESLWRMSERVGERAALAFFASNLHEQVQAGKIQDAEAAAACRMLDQAGYGRLRGSASSGLPSLHGYPRAVTA